MTSMTDLHALGFIRVNEFQRAWNLGPALVVDGILGPKTAAAITTSIRRKGQGLGDLSAHFSAAEFACKCGGREPGCLRTRVHRQLLIDLEAHRAEHAPAGLVIVSGYRCPRRNAQVGGAAVSQHLFGTAADLVPLVDKDRVVADRRFAGIGYQGGTDKVRHVDRRDVDDVAGIHPATVNPTDGTPKHPTTWRYA